MSSSSKTETNIVERAREFAIKAHGDQKYGDKPYVYHLDAVAEIVRQSTGDDTGILVDAAYLHDTLEDTDVTFGDIAKEFNILTACAVSVCTDPPGRNRRLRKKSANQQMSQCDSNMRGALIVKAADRLANVREGTKNDMYAQEHDEFRKAAYRPGLCDDIWNELDERIEAHRKAKA